MVNTCTVFPCSDAVATIFFSMPGLGATVQGWRLLEGGSNKLQVPMSQLSLLKDVPTGLHLRQLLEGGI